MRIVDAFSGEVVRVRSAVQERSAGCDQTDQMLSSSAGGKQAAAERRLTVVSGEGGRCGATLWICWLAGVLTHLERLKAAGAVVDGVVSRRGGERGVLCC